MQITHGSLLGGRLRYAQPRDGYRTGIEPVLLAASVPAQPGQRILEAGTGAGAGLLCLNARVPRLQAIGIEIDPDMADLARRNLHDNGFHATEVITVDITAVTLGPFDHAFANPPWHDPRATASPLDRRRRAKQQTGVDLERWIAAIARMLTQAGSLTLILPPALLDRAQAALIDARFGKITIRKLLPKQDRPPKLVLARARHASEPIETESETVLHQPDGSFMPEIDAVLRSGAAMPEIGTEAAAGPATAA